MPFVFIDPDTVQRCPIGDATILYKECPGCEWRNRLQDPKFMDPASGVVDSVAVTFSIFKDFIVGWEGIQDVNGEDIPFTKDNLERLVPLMTNAAINRLDMAISATVREGADSGKDSENASGG